MQPSKQQLTALTGIRAIAAYMVFFHHYKRYIVSREWNTLYNFCNELHVGVTVFFVLSGFLIAYNYYDSNNLDFRNYIVNRLARIYPMYFILTTATFIFLYYSNDSNEHLWYTFILNISFLRGFFDNIKFSGIGQGWSLTVEMLFYLTAPLSFLLIRKRKIYLLLIPALLITAGIILTAIFGNKNNSNFFASYNFMFIYTYFGRCTEFFIGIALAIFFTGKQKAIKTKWCTYTGAAIIMICIYALSLVKGDNKFGVNTMPGVLINNLVLPLFGVAILFWGLLTEKTFVSRILSGKLFVLLGKSSYTFYLIHMGFIFSLLGLFIYNIWLKFLLLNIISIILFIWVEEPLHQLTRRKFQKSKPK
jgi:peptidoglycan/LPS O-acetylase OafA/YrhL